MLANLKKFANKNYLAMIYEAEYLTEKNSNPFWSLNQSEKMQEDEWVAMGNILIPKIASLGTTIEQLKAIFDGKFANFFWNHAMTHGDCAHFETSLCSFMDPGLTTSSAPLRDIFTPGYYQCFLIIQGVPKVTTHPL